MRIDINIFFIIFFFFSIISSFLVIVSKNPLHSIIFLILVFCNVALLLLLQEIEFLSMVFLIVYIGAIAVLFLFVVYMLNIKIIELSELNWQYLIGLFISFIFLFLFILGLIFLNNNSSLNSIVITENYDYVNWLGFVYDLNNIQILATILYLDYFIIFIFLSLVLLLAMLGAIVLTSKRTLFLKEQIIFEQNFRKFKN